LPPPATLQQFDAVVDNGAERIFTMAEAEQAHRHALERSQISDERRILQTGQLAGLCVSVLSIGGAIVTALHGAHWSVSVALVSVPMASIVRAFLATRK
jgi:uncharacterized membrane protein